MEEIQSQTHRESIAGRSGEYATHPLNTLSIFKLNEETQSQTHRESIAGGSVEYASHPLNTLSIDVWLGFNTRSMGGKFNGKIEPYVILSQEEQNFKSETINNNYNPEWELSSSFKLNGESQKDDPIDEFLTLVEKSAMPKPSITKVEEHSEPK